MRHPNTRRLHIAALSLCLVFLLPACSSPARESTPPPPAAAIPVAIYSAGAGSAFLPYAQGIARIAAADGLTVRVVETGGSIDNLRRLSDDPAALATVFLGTAHEAVTGQGSWTQGQRFHRLVALWPMYETTFHVVALRASGIDRLTAVEGKRVGVGPANGPAEAYWKGLTTALGIRAIPVNGTPAALIEELIAGRIDALWQGAPAPIPAIETVLKRTPAVVFAMDAREQQAMLKAFAFLSPSATKGGTYTGQPQAVSSVAAWNFVMAREDLPADTAYRLTRAVMSGDRAQHLGAWADGTRVEHAQYNTVVPFHPGAKRYYDEVAGKKLAR